MDDANQFQPHEKLLAQTQWLGRLATQLVPPAEQEDLVQDVLLTAMRRRGEPTHTRGWLATVARNLATRRGQRARNREAREREVATRAAGDGNRAPDPAAAVEAFASHQAVVNAVMALEEPYRTTLLLRFWEDLPPREVAARMDTPLETVRTRLKRGLARLRARLDQNAGGRRSWAVGLVQIAAVRESILAASAAATATAAATTTPPLAATLTGALAGALAMKKPILVGLAAVILATTALLYTSGPAEQPDAPDPNAAALTAQSGDNQTALVEEAATDGGISRPAAAASNRTADPSSLFASLEVRVSYRDGTPAAGVGIYLRPESDADLGAQRTTDSAGISRFPPLAAGGYRVLLARGGAAETIQLRAGSPTTHIIEIERGVKVLGRVLSLDEQPVADAQVYAFQPAHPDAMVPLTRTDAAGAFVVDDVLPGTQFCARANGWQPSGGRRSPRATGRPGQSTEVEIYLGARGFPLSGEVVDTNGRPVPHAWIGVAVDEDCRRNLEGLERVRGEDGDRMLDRECFCIRADGEGRFESTEIPWGSTVLIARGHGSQSNLVGVRATMVGRDAQNTTKIVARPGARVSGTVRDTRGQPYGGVELTAKLRGDLLIGELARGYGEYLCDRRATSAADGSFELTGLIASEYDLDRGNPSAEHLQKFSVVEGQDLHLDLDLERSWRLEVRVVDLTGTPLKGWAVAVTPAHEGADGTLQPVDVNARLLQNALTDAEGRYTAEGLGDTRVVLSIHGPNPEDGRHLRHASLVQPVEVGSGPVVAQVDPRMGSIAAVMLDSAGQPVTGGFVRCNRVGFGHRDTEILDRDGRFAYASLPAGEYALEIGGRKLPLLHRTVTVVAGAATDLGQVRWPIGISLEVELRDAAGEPLGPDAKPKLQIQSTAPATGAADQLTVADLNRVDGQPLWRSVPVLAGAYRLTVTGTGIGPFARDVQLREGAANRLTLHCRRGLAQQIAVAPPPASAARNDELFFGIRIRADDPGRALLVDHRFSGTLSAADRTVATTVELLPGQYTAFVYGEGGEGDVKFAVPEAGTHPLRVALR